MRKYKNSVVNKKEIHVITCNMCGEIINKNEFGYFDEYISIEKTWGYGSEYDGETHVIDICKHCYSELFRSLKVSPIAQNKSLFTNFLTY